MSQNIHNKSAWLAITVLAMLGVVAFAASPAGPLKGPGVAVAVKGTVPQIVSRIHHAVANSGMMVMGELHQGKVLSMTGLNVESETLFVGNPRVGKMLFSANPGAGAVVPIRINIYKDTAGQTVVRYVPPSQELDKFDNPTISKTARMLDKKLHGLVSMLAH